VAQGETKLLYPGLAGFYETMLPIAATFVRIVVGVMFLMHVSTKFKLGADAVAANVFSKNGIEPALMWTYIVMFLELAGGVCLIIGLFTRFIAAALAIEMLVALLSSAGRVCGRWRRIRVCPADRGGMLRHRNPRRRSLFG
jgi:putative oxidoreductase